MDGGRNQEIKSGHDLLSHLPPLAGSKQGYSDKPKIIHHGAYTQAVPVKEEKHYRGVSDSIGNNYSPQANNLSTRGIYKKLKNSSGQVLVQRHGDDSNGYMYISKSNVVLEEKLPLQQNKQSQKRFPPLYDQLPITERLGRAEMLDQSFTSIGRLNKPKPPDGQKPQSHMARPFTKFSNSNDNGSLKQEKNDTIVGKEDSKLHATISWRDAYHPSGVARNQIPSQVGEPEVFFRV